MRTGFVVLLLLPFWPLGSQPAPSTAELFGPGVLSVGEVFRGSFTPDGNVFYFFKKIGSGEDYRIYSSNRAATVVRDFSTFHRVPLADALASISVVPRGK